MTQPQDDNEREQHGSPSGATPAAPPTIPPSTIPDSEISHSEEENRAALQATPSQTTDPDLAQSEEATNDPAGSHTPGPTQQQDPETANQDSGSRPLLHTALENGSESRPRLNPIATVTIPPRNRQASGQGPVCHLCRDDVDHTALLVRGCGQRVCDNCVIVRVQEACDDERNYPPRCCWANCIVLSDPVLQRLPGDLGQRYLDRQEEIGMIPVRRTYCWFRTCRRYIPMRNINDRLRGLCVANDCQRWTCAVCRKKAHGYWILNTPMDFAFHWSHRRCPHCAQAIARRCTGRSCSFVGQWIRAAQRQMLRGLLTTCIACPSCHHNYCFDCGHFWYLCSCA